MTKTHTPLIIEGKIYVVVDAPEKPYFFQYIDPSKTHESKMEYNRAMVRFEDAEKQYQLQLSTCTKYETLPEHAPYWEERIGERVEVEIGKDFHTGGQLITEQGVYYAIPPQQKQGDEWDEVMKDIVDYEQGKMMICDLLEGFKSNYNIKRKQ